MLQLENTTNFVKVNDGISGRMMKVKKFDLIQPVFCLTLTYLIHFQNCFSLIYCTSQLELS